MFESRQETLLAIDAGTQSVRVLAFNAQGTLVDHTQIVYPEPYFSREPGWAEQDPAYLWDKLGEACRMLWAKGHVTPDSLSGVSLTTQRGTIVNLDGEGKPLRPAMLWLDQRRARHLPSLGPVWQTAFALLGLTNTLRHLQAEAEINWLCEHQPDIVEKTRHYLFLSGYFMYRLTGRFVDSVGNQVGYVPFDYRNQTWERASSWKWRALPVHPDTLPELIPPGAIAGTVTKEAALATGIPRGLPVIAGASDKATEVLGAGCLYLHQGCIGYGTTATVSVNSARYLEPIRLLPAYPSAFPGAYNLEVQTLRGFWMVSWFKEQFAHLEQNMALEKKLVVEELLEELASSVPPGSMGLVLQPFWSPGIRYPGPEAKGAIVGFGGVHKREHLYRALLEGIAYAVREGKERIERRSRVPITEIYVCGGGSKSQTAMQITADVFNLPAKRPSVYETAGLGAAMLTAVGTKLHADLPSAIREMTGTGQLFEPNPKAVKIYDELYRKVYVKMYKKLQPLYKEIQSIINYPETL